MKMYNDIKLHILMPYEEQAMNWSEEYRDRYFTIHEKVDTVELLSYHYYDGCYEAANEEMTSRSDGVILMNT